MTKTNENLVLIPHTNNCCSHISSYFDTSALADEAIAAVTSSTD